MTQHKYKIRSMQATSLSHQLVVQIVNDAELHSMKSRRYVSILPLLG